MTREEIEKASKKYANNYGNQSCKSMKDQLYDDGREIGFIDGFICAIRINLENKRQAYIDRIGYEPESKHLDNWNLQIDLLNKKIDEL